MEPRASAIRAPAAFEPVSDIALERMMDQARTKRALRLGIAFLAMSLLVLAALVLLALWTTTGRSERAANGANAMSPGLASAAVPLSRFPPGCAVAIAGSRSGETWLLPRAGLVVTNHSPHRVALLVEARAGTGPAGTDLGAIEPGETRAFQHVLPAGRSFVRAGSARDESGGKPVRQVIYMWNYGPLTCGRKFLWTVR